MKAESGKVSHAFHWIVVGLFGLATAALVFAQAVTFQDNCNVFQHQYVTFSTASPTAKLISGVAGTTIYICKIHISSSVAYASPSLTLYSGTGSTCGTGTTTIGTFGGGSAAGVNAEIGDGGHTMTNTVMGQNLCSVTTATTFANGVIEYVQK